MILNPTKLKALIKSHGFTIKSFGDSIGMTRNGVYDILKREYLKGDLINDIAKVLKVQSSEFIDYDIKESAKKNVTRGTADYFQTAEKAIPYYDVDVSAGRITLFDDNKEIPKSYVSFPAFDDCDFAINIWGDSMYPKYRNGDVIICKEIHDWKSFVQYGECYLIVTHSKHGDSQRFVKFVRKSERKEHFKMVSENQKHDAFDVPVTEIRKMYIVKGKLERNQI